MLLSAKLEFRYVSVNYLSVPICHHVPTDYVIAWCLPHPRRSGRKPTSRWAVFVLNSLAWRGTRREGGTHGQTWMGCTELVGCWMQAWRLSCNPAHDVCPYAISLSNCAVCEAADLILQFSHHSDIAFGICFVLFLIRITLKYSDLILQQAEHS